MDLNLQKNNNSKKKTKKYIINTFIILFMLGFGNLFGEFLSPGVTEDQYNSAKSEYEKTLQDLEAKQSELDKINSHITTKTSNIDNLNSQLEQEKNQ